MISKLHYSDGFQISCVQPQITRFLQSQTIHKRPAEKLTVTDHTYTYTHLEHGLELIQRMLHTDHTCTEKRRLLDIEFLNCSNMEFLLKTLSVINQIQTIERYNYT
jgi:hypothetical protein